MKPQTKHVFSYNIYLIGFMGSGKSTISDYLTAHYGMEKIEMDQRIAQNEGMSISEIFETHGEEYFRNLETELLRGLQDKKNVVVSCGGGTPMRECNVTQMKKNGKVVLLTASPETIYERVKDSNDRPLLEGRKNTAFISELMEQRRPRYEAAADLIIQTDGKTCAAICEELAGRLMEWESGDTACKDHADRKAADTNAAFTNETPGNETIGNETIGNVTVRNVVIGAGIPKICVPVMGVTEDEILKEAKQLRQFPADLAEWRADWYAYGNDAGKVLTVVRRLREILGETPLLFTFRTKKEGGNADIRLENYLELNEAVAQSGFVDLLDVELFSGEAAVSRLVQTTHACGVKVIASSHDFEKTPEKEEIIRRLCAMQRLDADILKIAVMPRCRADVFVLLTATEEMCTNYADRPVVTMSMGSDGVVSRLCGELSGSAITFGAAGKASAPGQMRVETLAQILREIHDSMGSR